MSNKEVLVRDMVIGRQDNKRKEQRDAETSAKKNKKKHHERIARGPPKKPKHAKITREAATRRVPGTSVRWGSARVAGVYFALNLFRRALYMRHR